jgi:PAS domain S-box-containing protein
MTKQAQAKVRGQETAPEQGADRSFLLSAAAQSSTDAIVTVTPDGLIASWNPAAELLFGFTAAEAIGKSADIIVPDDHRAELEIIIGKIWRGDSVDHHETVRRTKDGRRIDVSLSISPIKSQAGVIIGTCKIARDVTKRRLTEEKFKLAVEGSPSGILMTDHAGHIVMINLAAERLFGYRRHELIGRPIDVLLPESLSGRRKDGAEFPVEVALNPIETREGMLTLIVIHDIAERQRLDRVKDEFVATVSHELRTPLTSIAGSLGLLLGSAADDISEPARRLLAIAHANSQRLAKLVNDVLDIKKLESGHAGFMFEGVELRTLIEQTVEANQGFADTYLVRLRQDVAEDMEVWADPDRLSQVITNLLSNAIKFSPPGGEVVVTAKHFGNAVRISVRDRGAGISAEFKSRIFQKFAQAEGSNRKRTAGTGLGLSIVKEIVTRLGGEVGFDHAPGGGTIFYVDLQRCEHSAVIQPSPRSTEVFKRTA